jgi:hypothetical protein
MSLSFLIFVQDLMGRRNGKRRRRWNAPLFGHARKKEIIFPVACVKSSLGASVRASTQGLPAAIAAPDQGPPLRLRKTAVASRAIRKYRHIPAMASKTVGKLLHKNRRNTGIEKFAFQRR